MPPIIFLRTAWMKDYKGITPTDRPYGAGSYVKENKDGGEVENFLSVNNKYYGFARIANAKNLRIERLGAGHDDEKIENVTVVFFATNPFFGGQYVVGWYDNATVFRSVQTISRGRKSHPYYLAVTAASSGKLIDTPFRKFEIPSDGPGQTNAWYVMEYKDSGAFLEEFKKFKKDFKGYKRPKKGRSIAGGKGWQLDAEKRKRIEVAAMDATAVYFAELGFDINYVHNLKWGWDLEAVKGKLKLKLEVKGTSNGLQTIELTPNEYIHSKKHHSYRVCILENALDKLNQKLHVCQLHDNKKHWVSHLGVQLKIVEIMSAQLRKD